MGIKITVLSGEKFDLSITFSAHRQQGVVVKTASGADVYRINSDDNPGGGYWGVDKTTSGSVAETYTIEAFHKKERTGHHKWEPNPEKEDNKSWERREERVHLEIGTEDGADIDNNDTRLIMDWNNFKRSTVENIYHTFPSQPF